MAPRSTLQKIGLIFLASRIVPSVSALNFAISAAQALGVLEQRDSTCPDSSYSSCLTVDPKLPSDFCCPSDDVCISIASSSSALCCPAGKSCSAITPISCNVQSQNVTQNPDAPIMTTNLTGSLPTCGRNCCPFGYTCDSTGSICNILTATSSLNPSFNSSSSSAAPSATSSATSTTSSSKTTSHASASATAAANNGTGIDSNLHSTVQCTRFPGPAVLAGFFPGMLAGALLALLAVICIGRRRNDSGSTIKSPLSNKFSSHYRGRSSDGAIIGVSEPIPISQSARTDFLRREPESEMLDRSNTKSRMKSWFSNSAKSSPTYAEDGYPYPQHNTWKMPTPPEPNNIPLGPLGATIPVTPERQIRTANQGVAKEPSMESIKVYSPPSIMGNNSHPPLPQLNQTPVKPIRTMASQWRGSGVSTTQQQERQLSPFRTPNRDMDRDSEYPPTVHHATTTTPSEVDMNATTILSPSRYNDNTTNTNNNNFRRIRDDVSDMSDRSRPTTTFTDMLTGIGFPDPSRPNPPPAMPDMPRGLDVKGKGRRI